MAQDNRFILWLSCRDSSGIVYAIAGLSYPGGCSSMDSQQFGDLQGGDATGLFFMHTLCGHVEQRVPMNGHKTVAFR